MDLLFTKSPHGLIPACDEASEWLRKKKLGVTILVEPREMRHGTFFRKWWALVKFGFDYWEESAAPMEYRGKPVLPDFDRFRKDITISAGFYNPVVNLKGEMRIEPESLKWAAMSEERFEKLYNATINVLLERVFNGRVCKGLSEPELRMAVDELMRFAA